MRLYIFITPSRGVIQTEIGASSNNELSTQRLQPGVFQFLRILALYKRENSRHRPSFSWVEKIEQIEPEWVAEKRERARIRPPLELSHSSQNGLEWASGLET